jgi:hypothetical protein
MHRNLSICPVQLAFEEAAFRPGLLGPFLPTEGAPDDESSGAQQEGSRGVEGEQVATELGMTTLKREEEEEEEDNVRRHWTFTRTFCSHPPHGPWSLISWPRGTSCSQLQQVP